MSRTATISFTNTLYVVYGQINCGTQRTSCQKMEVKSVMETSNKKAHVLMSGTTFRHLRSRRSGTQGLSMHDPQPVGSQSNPNDSGNARQSCTAIRMLSKKIWSEKPVNRQFSLFTQPVRGWSTRWRCALIVNHLHVLSAIQMHSRKRGKPPLCRRKRLTSHAELQGEHRTLRAAEPRIDEHGKS